VIAVAMYRGSPASAARMAGWFSPNSHQFRRYDSRGFWSRSGFARFSLSSAVEPAREPISSTLARG
jgi:hypothetical protein